MAKKRRRFLVCDLLPLTFLLVNYPVKNFLHFL